MAPSERLFVGTSRQPEHTDAFLGGHLLEQFDARLAALGAARQEDHPDAVGAGWADLDAGLARGSREERMRQLDEQPGAIARVLLRARGAAMLQVDEDRERVAHDLLRPSAPDVTDEAEAARIVLERRFVEA